MNADFLFELENFENAVINVKHAIDDIEQIYSIIENMSGYSYVLSSDTKGIGHSCYSSGKNKVHNILEELELFLTDMNNYKDSVTSVNPVYGDMTEIASNYYYRDKTKDFFGKFFDWDGDGVGGLTEFSQNLSNFDYTGFYGDNVIVTSDGYQISGYMIDWFAKNIFSPTLATTENILVDTEEFIIDYAFDYAISEEYANARLGASVMNGGVALAEGTVELGEAGVDTLIDLSAKASYYEQLNQAYEYEIFGHEEYANMLRDSANALKVSSAEMVSYDASNEWFSKMYETEFMSGVNNLSYDGFKRNSDGKSNGVFYEGCKSIGYYLPIMYVTNYASVSMGHNFGITGSAEKILKSGVQATIVADASYGKNVEKNYNKVFDNAVEEGRSVTNEELNLASAKASTKAFIDAGVVFSSGFAKTKMNSNTANIAIKALKPTISELSMSMIYDDKSFVESVESAEWDKIWIETAAIVIAENIGSKAGSKAPKGGSSSIKNADYLNTMASNTEISTPSTTDWISVNNGFYKDLFARIAKEPTNKFINDEY